MTQTSNQQLPSSNYNCSTCYDKRFVYIDAPGYVFGKAYPCPRCSSSAPIISPSSVPPHYAHAQITDFPSLASLASTLSSSFNPTTPHRFIVAQGPIGVGKTHLLAAIVNFAYSHNLPAIFVNTVSLHHTLEKFRYNHDDPITTLAQPFALALDEFDHVSPSPFTYEQLFDLINRRYSRANGITAIAVNSLDSLWPDLDTSAIRSRLTARNAILIKLHGPDRRHAKNQILSP